MSVTWELEKKGRELGKKGTLLSPWLMAKAEIQQQSVQSGMISFLLSRAACGLNPSMVIPTQIYVINRITLLMSVRKEIQYNIKNIAYLAAYDDQAKSFKNVKQ